MRNWLRNSVLFGSVAAVSLGVGSVGGYFGRPYVDLYLPRESELNCDLDDRDLSMFQETFEFRARKIPSPFKPFYAVGSDGYYYKMEPDAEKISLRISPEPIYVIRPLEDLSGRNELVSSDRHLD